jgi:hypothetical protein
MGKQKELQIVVAVQDQDSHWYVIPAGLQDAFRQMEEDGESDEWERFNAIFSQYRTGGTDRKL